MKVRRVVVAVEVETNHTILDLKKYVVRQLNTNPNTDQPQTVEVKQVQVNVIQTHRLLKKS